MELNYVVRYLLVLNIQRIFGPVTKTFQTTGRKRIDVWSNLLWLNIAIQIFCYSISGCQIGPVNHWTDILQCAHIQHSGWTQRCVLCTQSKGLTQGAACSPGAASPGTSMCCPQRAGLDWPHTLHTVHRASMECALPMVLTGSSAACSTVHQSLLPHAACTPNLLCHMQYSSSLCQVQPCAPCATYAGPGACCACSPWGWHGSGTTCSMQAGSTSQATCSAPNWPLCCLQCWI